jgi:amino acid transporter
MNDIKLALQVILVIMGLVTISFGTYNAVAEPHIVGFFLAIGLVLIGADLIMSAFGTPLFSFDIFRSSRESEPFED